MTTKEVIQYLRNAVSDPTISREDIADTAIWEIIRLKQERDRLFDTKEQLIKDFGELRKRLSEEGG